MAKKDKAVVHDELAEALTDTINKKFKDKGFKSAYFLDVDKDNPSNIKDWISTGSYMLDLAISNRPNGGIPVGRICEVMGLEASGKSLLVSHILANTQKKNGLAVYIDTEAAIDEQFLQAIGVDLNKLMYIPMDTVEDIFETIETIITQVRESSKDKLVTIVVDSIMGVSTKKEMDAEWSKDGYATDKAIVLSKAMRKITNLIAKEKISLIFTNQLRQKMNAMFGDPYTTAGGKAIGFHSSVRLRLKQMGQIKVPTPGNSTLIQTVGIKTRATVSKNRMGPPLKSVDYDIYFDSGIDNYGGWLDTLKTYKVVKSSGSWYTYVNKETGEELKFQSKEFIDIISDTKLKEQLYQELCDKFILKYTPNVDGGIDDIIVELNEEEPIKKPTKN